MTTPLAIDVKGLTKHFGAKVAVDHVDAREVLLHERLRSEPVVRHPFLELYDGDLFEIGRGRGARGCGASVRQDCGHRRCGRRCGDALAKEIATRETVGCAWMGQGFPPLAPPCPPSARKITPRRGSRPRRLRVCPASG